MTNYRLIAAVIADVPNGSELSHWSRPSRKMRYGLSTDPKPTLKDGYGFIETDTGAVFIRQNGSWDEVVSSGGGGSAPIDAWPVGSVFMAVVATNPATLLGGGTWSAIGAGRVLVGFNAADADFDTDEKTGGSKTHTLTTAQIPAHTHVQDAHTHVQDAHSHTIPVGATDDTAAPFDRADAGTNASGANASASTGTATAVNQNATAVNQNAGGGEAHPIVQPYFVVHMWKRIA